MTASTLTIGERYSVEFRCRDIGYGVEEGNDTFTYRGVVFGTALYGPTVRAAENNNRGLMSWDELLGYVELSKLGAALVEYAERPSDVRAFVDRLMLAEEADKDVSAEVDS